MPSRPLDSSTTAFAARLCQVDAKTLPAVCVQSRQRAKRLHTRVSSLICISTVAPGWLIVFNLGKTVVAVARIPVDSDISDAVHADTFDSGLVTVPENPP